LTFAVSFDCALDVTSVDADDFEMMIVANIAAVGHTVVEGARYVLLEQIAVKAMLWDFFMLQVAFNMWGGGCLVRNCPDYATEEIIELSRHDAGCFSEGRESVTHLADEPETEINDETFQLFHI
jgi:hypothetical protein